MNHQVWKTATLIVSIALTCNLYGQQSHDAAKNLKVLPQDTPHQRLMEMMMGMSRSLGVKCDHCHIPNEFDKDDKPEKEVARAMMRMMGNLRQNADLFFPGGRIQKVNCWTCHRGSAKIEVPPRPEPGGGQGGEQKPAKQQ